MKYGYFAETPDWKLTSRFFGSWNNFLSAFVKAKADVERAIKAESSDSPPNRFPFKKRSELFKINDLKANEIKSSPFESLVEDKTERDNHGKIFITFPSPPFNYF